jgi:hypothetical protein
MRWDGTCTEIEKPLLPADMEPRKAPYNLLQSIFPAGSIELAN